MQSRRAAFTIFRRLATQGSRSQIHAPSIPSRIHSRSLTSSRSLNYFATTSLRAPTSTQHEAGPPAVQAETKPHAPRVSRLEAEKSQYEISFTCKPCSSRSTHRITKHAYHHGSVLITCPSCRNRHIISDNLGIFMDKSMTMEDLMKERGQLVKRGTLSNNGDIEFWEDGTQTKRKGDETDDRLSV